MILLVVLNALSLMQLKDFIVFINFKIIAILTA